MKRLHGSRGAATLAIGDEKAALRAGMRVLRRRIARENFHIADSLTWPPGIPPAMRERVIAGYAPVGSELDPGPLMGRLVEDGWRRALPRATNRDEPLRFFAAGDPLTADAFNIPAPSETSEPLIPDVVIVPVLAFDRRGGRLGQGAGCYDRTLAALRAMGPVFAIGLAYAGQEIDRVPTDGHDQPLDAILTENGYRAFGRTP